MVKLALLVAIISSLASITYECQSGMEATIRHYQKRNPQKCMQCKKIGIYAFKDVVSGQSSVHYYPHYEVQYCARADIHCSTMSSGRTTDSSLVAVIAIEKGYNQTTINYDASDDNVDGSGDTFVEDTVPMDDEVLIRDSRVLDEEGSGAAMDEISLDREYFNLSSKSKYYTTATLKCNDEAEWEIDTADDGKFTGIETVYCLIGNPDEF